MWLRFLPGEWNCVMAGWSAITRSQRLAKASFPARSNHRKPKEMIYQLERTETVSLGVDACWHFFSNPRNLEKITPPSLNFRIKRRLPEEIYPGLLIEYRVSPLLGIPVTWLTEIVQ